MGLGPNATVLRVLFTGFVDNKSVQILPRNKQAVGIVQNNDDFNGRTLPR